MTPSPVRAALHPVLSSPKRLALGGLGVILVVYALQLASGLPPAISWSPVELSSNVVAVAGFAWTLIQLRACWADRALRRAWIAGSIGMAVLSVEGSVGDLFLLDTGGPYEMTLSIALWLVAAALIFRAGRRYAMRRSVQHVLRAGLAIQIGAQSIGWCAAYNAISETDNELLGYFNDTGELLAVLAYLSALLLAVFSADKSYAFPLDAIGRKGRAIYRDFNLRRAAPRPLSRLPIARLAATAAAIADCWRRAARTVARGGGPGAGRQLLDLLRCAALRRVDPRSYYQLTLFVARPLGAGADAVMTAAETANGLTASIQATRRAPDRPPDFEDRLAFARICAARGLPTAPILGLFEDGAFEPFTTDADALDQDLVVVARHAADDPFGLCLARVEPMLYCDDDGTFANVDMVLARLSALSRRRSLIVRARTRNHDSVARYASAAPLAFRVVTCLDEAGEPRVTHGVMRLLREPGWPAGPGATFGAAIDLASGVFGPVVGDAVETCAAWSYAHPATGEMIAGRVCGGWRQLAQAAVAAHRAFDGPVVVGWDLAWTPEGPQILSGDANMDFAFIQRCTGVPIGRSPLAPLLDAHLDRVVALHA